MPERWRPGTFDIFGSSHQIFHVLVLLAAASHFVGLLNAFDHEHKYRSGALDAYGKARGFGIPPRFGGVVDEVSLGWHY